MAPFVKEITVMRTGPAGTQSDTYTVGVVGGVVSVADDRTPAGPTRHFAARWEDDALVVESGIFTGSDRETGVWSERRETWSLDASDQLRLVIETRGSQERPLTTTLVYRRR